MVLFKLSMQVNGLKAKLPTHISQSHSTHKASTCTFRYLKGDSLFHPKMKAPLILDPGTVTLG